MDGLCYDSKFDLFHGVILNPNTFEGEISFMSFSIKEFLLNRAGKIL